MPPIQKRRTNRVLVKHGQRYTNSKAKTRNILCGKLKSNNNLLAKALSIQKQENQLLFTQNIKLSSELQNAIGACNKRDAVVKRVENNSKELLSLLVTMTNIVTNNIVCCQQLTQTSEGRTSQPSAVPRRESTRRLSIKSPARGVVKPMVSGHPITKPTINLRRVKMPRLNNVTDLSLIEEASPNASQTQASSFTARLGHEGGHRRRMPERIPIEYVEADDEDSTNISRHETRLSERFSARLSSRRNSISRKRSRNSLVMGQIQSPRVSVCDVSKLLRNSHSINVRMLEDFRRSGDSNGSFIRPSTGVENSSQNSSGIASDSSTDVVTPESQGVPKKIAKTIPCNSNTAVTVPSENLKTIRQSARDLEIDPLEGPSWLHGTSATSPLSQGSEEEEQTVEIARRKHVLRKLNSLSPEERSINSSADETMEFTECVNPARKIFNDSISNLIAEINAPTSNNWNNAGNSTNFLNHSVEDERCTNVAVDHLDQFVTDRRKVYSIADEDNDDDTIMLHLSGRSKALNSNIDVFRLPDVNLDVIALPKDDDSEPEVTTTIHVIPQNRMAPKLLDNDIGERESNAGILELPKVDDTVKAKKEIPKQLVDKKHKPKRVDFHEFYSSDSDAESEGNKQMGQPVRNIAAKTARRLKNKKKASKNVEIERRSSSELEGELEAGKKENQQIKNQEPKNVKKKVNRNQARKISELSENESTDSNGSSKTSKKITESAINTKVRDPKSAKIVLQKLDNSTSQGNKSLATTDQSFADKSYELNATSLRTFDASSSSEQSTSGRPRRQKAPTNLKEQSLMIKLRRE